MTMSGTDPDQLGAPSGRSLYDTLGGAAMVREAVDRFYLRVLDDPSLTAFFEGVDLSRLKRHQALVIAGILGGPQEYEGVGLRAAHQGLAIGAEDYDRVRTHLLAVLDELGAGQEAASVVGAALARVRGDIVSETTSRG
jgi:hemoglobin